MQNKANLARPKINASSVVKKDYENESAVGSQENKPNQSQFPGFSNCSLLYGVV